MSRGGSLVESLESRLLFASGDLDIALNNDHLATTAFHFGFSQVNDVAALPDGGFVAVGQAVNKHGTVRAAIAEYSFDGTLNAAFGDNGTVVGLPDSIVSPDHVRIGSDGSIYLLQANLGAMTKLTGAGAVDFTFGSGGAISISDFTGINGFTLDVSDNILIAGTKPLVTDGKNGPADGDLRRYQSDGRIDPSFHGGSDFAMAPLGKTQTQAQYRRLAFGAPVVDSAGNILVPVADALHANPKSGVVDLTNNYLYRFTSAGKIDRSFGSAGNVQLADGAASIAGLSGDGHIVVDINNHLSQYDSTGALDTQYGNAGVSPVAVTPGTRLASGNLFGVAPDGSVSAIVASSDPTTKFDIAHILKDGTIDSAFGVNGLVSPAVLGQSYADGLTLAPDGTVLIGGQVGSLSPSGKVDTRTFAVARLYASKGPAIQLTPRKLSAPQRYLTMTVLIRDNEGVKLSSLDNNDLKLFDASGNTRKIRFAGSTDIITDRYIRATYRIAAPGDGALWSSADNGTYQVRLMPSQIEDDNSNPAMAQVLGTVRIKIA